MKLSLRSRLALGSLVIGCLAVLASCSKEKTAAAAKENKPSGESTVPAPTVAPGEVAAGESTPATPDATSGSDEEGDTGDSAVDGEKGDAVMKEPNADSSEEETNAAAAALSLSEGMKRFLAAESETARIAAIRELAESGDEALGSVVRSALEDESEGSGDEVIRAAGGLADAQAAEILGIAAKEGSPEVAAAAIEAARAHGEEVQMAVLRNGLTSEDAGTRQKAVMEFATARPKYRIDYIFPSIEDADPGVSTAAVEVLEGIFGERFESASAADGWWAGHATEFDPKLNRVAPVEE